LITGKRDQQTVTPEGEKICRLIAGVTVRKATTHIDERGEICEIYNPAWGLMDAPLVYVYQATVRPGKIKGWVYHEFQEDRLFVSMGYLKIVLYDLRENSPTSGLINEIHLSERNRGLLTIPSLVAHAVQNIGNCDALFVNMPTQPFNHLQPDKIRIPMNLERIPYNFDRGPGW
jgi:dTDP-4-dehydrorhamnose 3,5-epimerase